MEPRTRNLAKIGIVWHEHKSRYSSVTPIHGQHEGIYFKGPVPLSIHSST